MTFDPGPAIDTPLARIAVFSPWLVPFVGEGFPLNGQSVVLRPSTKAARTLAAVAGTGPGPLDDGAFAYAQRHQLPFLRVELGMYCSAVSGRKARPWSIVVHPACSPSAVDTTEYAPIERLLSDNDEHGALESPELLVRAERVRRYLVEHELSRFADDFAEPTFPDSKGLDETIVVVVVPVGLYGAATSTEALVERALREHPESRVGLILETEPLSGRVAQRPEQFDGHSRVFTLPVDVARGSVFEHCSHVYTDASLIGFEALLRAIPVTVLGKPFYAGWGLTRDLDPDVQRRRSRSLDELVAAALLVAPGYLDPVRQCRTTAEEALSHLSLQRTRFLENRGRFLCVGFSLWKRAIVSAYLTSKGNEVVFLRNASNLSRVTPKANTKVVVWASRPHDDSEGFARAHALALWRLEDGFLRSVGLGSDWSAPGSLVFDSKGIYYDPRQPSELETLLETTEFTDEELTYAEELRTLIVALRISKYNTLSERSFRAKNRPGQKVIFVPGQVADDASVRFGGTRVGSVENLLRTVRQQAPEAHIVYKPHPDVLSGNRRGYVGEGLGTWFDELVLEVPIASCLDGVDEVHTISSLVGFEALLRHIPVVCHGQPFYAGWGLTQDLTPISRRTRTLSLPMLVAGTLMRYPRYYHFPSGCFCSAAQMAAALSASQRSEPRTRLQPKLIRRIRSLLQLAKDLSHAG
jgi:capsular polysaccharide export protein